jgi:hypothetical protein
LSLPKLPSGAVHARLWQGQGRIKEAHDLLAHARGWFTKGFDTADLKEAKAELGITQEYRRATV